MGSLPGGKIHVLNAAGVYLLKVNLNTIDKKCGICSKSTLKTLERNQLTPLRCLLVLIRLRSWEPDVSIKELFLKTSQFSQENTCVGVSAGFQTCKFIERDSNTGVFLWILQNFKNIYFEKQLPTAASADCKNFYRARESQIKMKFE